MTVFIQPLSAKKKTTKQNKTKNKTYYNVDIQNAPEIPDIYVLQQII